MFISPGIATASKRSRRRKIRACIFASIFAVRPFSQSSARALLLKLLIIVRQCKLLADFCQQLAYCIALLARACKTTRSLLCQQLPPAARGIIVPRRSNSAHLHRPWRVTSECVIGANRRRSCAWNNGETFLEKCE